MPNQLPAKDPNIIDKVRKALTNKEYRYTDHAMEQMLARRINSKEVSYILANGYHETSKVEFDSKRGNWKYALLGSTFDARVIVGFSSKLMIITVIDKDN